ncbi:hypothetical protein SAMD00019534_053570, partial [Acytostelium subglobosum LB1]|uniref:hypothetical protein n=1 Tax=Acytostelium subglobosum LB1 TaxID=1410327 RepID=UPI000644B796
MAVVPNMAIYHYRTGHESNRHASESLPDGAPYEQFRTAQVTRDLALFLRRWYTPGYPSWEVFASATRNYASGIGHNPNFNRIYTATGRQPWFDQLVRSDAIRPFFDAPICDWNNQIN